MLYPLDTTHPVPHTGRMTNTYQPPTADLDTIYSYRVTIPVHGTSYRTHGTLSTYRRDCLHVALLGGKVSRMFGADNRPVLLPEQDPRLVRDAYSIAWIGACNPKGVRHTIDGHLSRGVPADDVSIVAMMGHYDFLLGKSLGPSFDVLDKIRAAYEGLDD